MPDPATTEQPNTVEQELALFCPGCLYDLRGSSSDACPECGEKLDRELLAKSSIPWVHRKGLGLGAMLKTAWLATFKTELFCMQVARPVSLKDARKFRQQVAAMLTVVVMLFAAFLMIVVEDFRDPMEDLWRDRPVMMALLSVLPVIPVMLFMLAFTGVHMYWFHPRGLSVQQQNRAVALSHYACAPLVALVPALVIFGVGNVMGIIGNDTETDPLVWIAIGLILLGFAMTVIALVAYLFVCAHMARFAAHRSGPARVTMWLGLPVIWLGLAVTIFGVLPLAGFYVYLVVVSL